MRYRTIFIIALAVFLSVCIIAIVAGLIFLTRIPSVENVVYPGSTPVHVQLYAPNSPKGWPLNSYIPIGVQTRWGGTISTIELYINGQLYQKISAPKEWNQPEYAYTWDWQPGTPGTFILIAKATNLTGATGDSNPIRMEIHDAAMMVTTYRSEDGESLENRSIQSHC